MQDHEMKLAAEAQAVVLTGPAADQAQPEVNTLTPRPTLQGLRERLQDTKGREFWRSFRELASTDEFDEMVRAEFPRQAAAMGSVDRRDFFRLMGASLALAGMNGCTRQPIEKIVPYVNPPESLIPGNPLFFATAIAENGFGVGLLAESNMGRPTKLEGNPEHPASLGSTNAMTQAAVLSLYDPDRSQYVKRNGRLSTWNAFVEALTTELTTQSIEAGAGLRILTGPVTSPALADQMRQVLGTFPNAKWVRCSAESRDEIREGATLAFGEVVESVYRFDKAKAVLLLDSEVIERGPGNVRYARDLMSLRDPDAEMSRIYAAESMPTLAGAIADHRLSLRSSDIEGLARAVATELGLDAGGTSGDEHHAAWIHAVAADLQENRGKSLVVAGDHQPPIVHALAHAMNDALGNTGRTVVHIEPVEAAAGNDAEALAELVKDIDDGSVTALLILNANPVYDTPAELRFGERLSTVPFVAHLGLYDDETAALCPWHVPAAHFLESWSDVRAFDGSATIVQPLIEPLYRGKTTHDVLAVMLGRSGTPGFDMIRDYWKENGLADEAAWRKALHDGVIPNTASPVRQVKASITFEAPATYPEGLEINFRIDPSVGDGQYANSGWLQETPNPFTKLTWDNALLVSPATAEELGINSEDLVTVTYRERALQAPVWVVPGHADGSATIHLGGGRTRAGNVGTGVGVNAYKIRTADTLWFARGGTVIPLGLTFPLAATEEHNSIAQRSEVAQERHLVRSTTRDDYERHPDFAQHMVHSPDDDMTLYPGFDFSQGHQWGMTVNLNACIGCNACTVACQAENNIPVVGKDQVARGREMHWIRLDRYYEGDMADPKVHHQPVPCMHCENAPCETVCPVGATVHSAEGLNQMVYNRCVGTRYCSNNCPYKVRRFNYYQFTDLKTPQAKLLQNPNVTVRERGVMEKCTYCVQRINRSRIEAKKEGRSVRDGDLVTACQQACPTQAITFGNINDPDSAVSRSRSRPLNYGLLADLNVRPRTTYLAKVRNPNPALEAAAPADPHA